MTYSPTAKNATSSEAVNDARLATAARPLTPMAAMTANMTSRKWEVRGWSNGYRSATPAITSSTSRNSTVRATARRLAYTNVTSPARISGMLSQGLPESEQALEGLVTVHYKVEDSADALIRGRKRFELLPAVTERRRCRAPVQREVVRCNPRRAHHTRDNGVGCPLPATLRRRHDHE